MNRLAPLLYRLRSRTVLVAVALVLLALNLGRLAVQAYDNRREMVESRIAFLDQQRRAAADLEELQQRVETLQARRAALAKHFFRGTSEEEVASAMQIELQKMVAKTGLAPESLRPITRAKKEKEQRPYQELAIKLRLAGSLADFLSFIAELYRSDHLFQIESFVIKPTKRDLKILMDLKGFYTLAPPAEGEA